MMIMRHLIKLSIIVSIACMIAALSDNADAADIRLTWDRPTTRTDGTPLPVSQIARYEIEYTTGSTWRAKITKPLLTGYVMTGLTPGTAYTFRIRTVDSDGLVSVWSNTVTGVPGLPVPSVKFPPSPPSGCSP